MHGGAARSGQRASRVPPGSRACHRAPGHREQRHLPGLATEHRDAIRSKDLRAGNQLISVTQTFRSISTPPFGSTPCLRRLIRPQSTPPPASLPNLMKEGFLQTWRTPQGKRTCGSCSWHSGSSPLLLGKYPRSIRSPYWAYMPPLGGTPRLPRSMRQRFIMPSVSCMLSMIKGFSPTCRPPQVRGTSEACSLPFAS